MTAGAFAKTAPIKEARKSRIVSNCANSSGRAIDKPKIRRRSFVLESGRAELWVMGRWSDGVLGYCALCELHAATAGWEMPKRTAPLGA
jgi:hypothetical protein